MLKAIFTLDYEIHGNGDGCPRARMRTTLNLTAFAVGARMGAILKPIAS